jgi:hypothetical protein
MTDYIYRVVDKDGGHVGSGGSDRRVFSRPNQATALKNRMNRRYGDGHSVQRTPVIWEGIDSPSITETK